MDKRIAELSRILNKLYEDMALERISEERYQAMAPGYEQEQEMLRGRREQLTAEIARSEEIYENINKFLPVIQKYTDISELNAHILNELIEKIVVHEKEIDEDGVKSQRIDIYYKFIGYVDFREMLRDSVRALSDTPDDPKYEKFDPMCRQLSERIIANHRKNISPTVGFLLLFPLDRV